MTKEEQAVYDELRSFTDVSATDGFHISRWHLAKLKEARWMGREEQQCYKAIVKQLKALRVEINKRP